MGVARRPISRPPGPPARPGGGPPNGVPGDPLREQVRVPRRRPVAPGGQGPADRGIGRARRGHAGEDLAIILPEQVRRVGRAEPAEGDFVDPLPCPLHPGPAIPEAGLVPTLGLDAQDHGQQGDEDCNS